MISPDQLAQEQLERRKRDYAMRTCQHCGFVAHCPICLRNHLYEQHKGADD